MKNNNKPQLIFVTADTAKACFRLNGEIETAEVQDDQDGQLYYMAGRKAYYLPKEWQPKSVNQ